MRCIARRWTAFSPGARVIALRISFSSMMSKVWGLPVALRMLISRLCICPSSAVQPTVTASPLLGEHTDEVLAELGYTAQQIAAMHEVKAV